MKFRDLTIGQEFDFIDDSKVGYNSFFLRCVKRGKLTYRIIETQQLCYVGSIKVEVFHVS